jgi:hypothetical protein
MVEACEEYDGLARRIGLSMGSEECAFAEEPLKFLNRLKIVVGMRSAVLQVSRSLALSLPGCFFFWLLAAR